MSGNYKEIVILPEEAEGIVLELFGIRGKAHSLPGDVDFNFRIDTGRERYLLKVSRPGAHEDYQEFQHAILKHVAGNSPEIVSPVPVQDLQGNYISAVPDQSGKIRKVRLLTWVEGRLWSAVNPVTDRLLFSLGEQAGRLTIALRGFEHPLANRQSEWDLAQAGWIGDHMNLFTGEKEELINHFQEQFDAIQEPYSQLRRSVVHNDANDNNVVVTEDLVDPEVKAIIDYGDAMFTQVINDVAITIAYAVMGLPDVLGATIPVVKGYHSRFA